MVSRHCCQAKALLSSLNGGSIPPTSTKWRGRAVVARWAHNPKVGGSNPPLAPKINNMAGNKFNPIEYERLQPKEYKLEYTGLYGDKTTLTGNARQVVMHILNQHL